MKGDYPKAIEPLSRLSNPGSSAYIVELRLGWLHARIQNWAESIVHYRKAVDAAPRAIEPRLGLMAAQQGAQKYADALLTGQDILRLDAVNYTALSRMAWILYSQQDYRRAAAYYRKLVTLYPGDTDMLLGLGFSLKFMGQAGEAAACFNKVLLLSPNNPRALEGLGRPPPTP